MAAPYRYSVSEGNRGGTENLPFFGLSVATNIDPGTVLRLSLVPGKVIEDPPLRTTTNLCSARVTLTLHTIERIG